MSTHRTPDEKLLEELESMLRAIETDIANPHRTLDVIKDKEAQIEKLRAEIVATQESWAKLPEIRDSLASRVSVLRRKIRNSNNSALKELIALEKRLSKLKSQLK